MEKRGLFTPLTSIKTRLLIFLLGMMTVAMVSVALVAVMINQISGNRAQTISSTALLAQAETYLLQLTKSNARENDKSLELVKRETQKISDYVAAVYENPGAFEQKGIWTVDEHMSFGPNRQYANSASDITSVFVPNFAKIDDNIIRDIELGAYLEHLFASAYDNTPNVEAIYFATPHEVTRYYPNIDLGSILPPDFQVTGRVWYKDSILENNPDKDPLWTAPYVDATGLGLVTTSAAPVYSRGGELIGVVGLDLTLSDLIANVEATRLLKSGYTFLIDHTGHTIALPEQGYKDFLGRAPEPGEIYIDLNQSHAQFKPIISRMVVGDTGLEHLDVGNRSIFVAFAPLNSTGWSLGSVIEADDILNSISSLKGQLNDTTRYTVLTRILPITTAIFILIVILGLFFTNRLVVPIQKLAAEAQKIGAGEWDITVPPTTNDEIGVLAGAFKAMAEQIHVFIRDLEKRVAERTRDLERRNTQLQVAAEIAREATAVHELDELLELAVNLIRGRFGFYHAGIFLLDENKEFAVLSAATGEAGREMLARGHKLRVGQTGMVGYATKRGQPRIALNVESDPTHYRNPLLPETRSEMTLPLKVGSVIIGALDVQSHFPDAFSQDDITIMQVLADQLAIAIENARLIQEAQEHVRQLEKLYGTYSKKAWNELRESSITLGYQYDSSGVKPIYRISNGHNTQNVSEAPPPSIQIPIQIRGQAIATLDIWHEGDKLDAETHALLNSIAERLSLALEGARLFEEEHQRAEYERVVGDVTSQFRATLDIQTVIQTAAREFRKVLNLEEAEVRLTNTQIDEKPDHGTQ